MSPAFTNMSAAPISRRDVLRLTGLGVALTCTCPTARPAFALKPGKPSKEKLLRGTREGKTEQEIEEEKLRIAEERKARLERQRKLQVEAEGKRAGIIHGTENQVEIESNLRGQYYFPTARKRYLPRVKLAWETIPDVEESTRRGQWPAVTRLSGTELTDAVLPMKLYASSLAGGGLSINAKFVEKMRSQTATYENALQQLVTAASRKDQKVALVKLTEMKGAIQKYREYGHLETDDFGIGEIPSDSRVGSGFGNNNSALYRKNKSVLDNAVDSQATR